MTGFTAGDSDSAQITAQVKVTGGTASFANVTNVTTSTDADGLISLTGAPADVASALASMSLKAAAAAQVTVSVKVIDGDSVTVDPSLVLSAKASAAPAVLTAPASAAIEQGHATTIAGISITDADSAQVEASVTAAGGSVAFAPGAGATVSAAGVWTITGSVAQVNSALASLKFTASSIGSASLTIVADDFDASTAAVTKVIALTVGANAAPDAGGDFQLAAVTEDTASTLSLANVHLHDSSGGAPTQIRILSVEGGVLTTATGSPITLGAAGTLLNVADALRFAPSLNRTADAHISYVVVDPDLSSQNSASSVITVPITAVNDAPVLALNAAPRVYVENAAPTVLASDLSLSDVDSTQLASATVTFSSAADASDVLAVAGALPTGVTASFANGTLTITGVASVSVYEAILKSVTFSNTSEAPSTATRQITFTVSDGAATSVAQVIEATVTPVNDAPVLDLNGAGEGTGAAASYVLGNAAVVLAPSATVSDPDGATVTEISAVVSGARSGDVLSLTEAASAAAAAAGVTVHAGIYSAVDHTLQLDITGAAISHALAQTILEGVAFSTTAAAGSLAVHFTVTDAGGAVSDAGTVLLDVQIPLDTTAPTAVITATGEQFAAGLKTAQIVFSEAVVGFTDSDLTITNGVIDNITTEDNKTFIVTFKATGPTGAITLSGDYADGARNAGVVGASLTFTSAAPQLIGDTSARTINEDANNLGRTVAPDLIVSDADNHDFSGGSLRAHIINRAVVPEVAGEVLGIRGLGDGSVYFRKIGDEIFYRQGASIDANGIVTSDANPYDDIWIGSFATVDGVKQDGTHGADLLIDLYDTATPAIAQLLAQSITLSIKLSDGSYTQAWQDFVRANTSVSFTLNDGQGNTSTFVKPVTVVPVNDAPEAAPDTNVVTGSAEDAATGNVLANDTDADNVAGMPTQQTLTVTDVAAGATHATFSNHSATLQGAYGVLTISDTGAYSYHPDASNADVLALAGDAFLTETFAYSISDGQGGTAASTLAITITASSVNVSPTAYSDSAQVTPYGLATGNVLLNDSDPEHQTLTVSSVSPADGSFTEVSPTGVTIEGLYGSLTIFADGHYSYAPHDLPASVGLFDTVHDAFTYEMSDGHGGSATATLSIDVVNSPIVIKAAPGTYTLSDTKGGVTIVVGTVVIPEGGASVIWTAPDTYNPTDGSHVLSLDKGATISLYGSEPSSSVSLVIEDIASLPATPAANTLYIVHDTRAHIEAAVSDTASLFNTLASNHSIMGVIVNGAGSAAGGLETFTSARVPVIGYDTQISLPTSARTVNEDDNNTGRLIAFKGTGLAIADGTAVDTSVGPVISDADGRDPAGSTLSVHINNSVRNSVGGDVLFLKTGSSLFRTDADGKIYYRDGTTIDGATSDAVTIDNDSSDDIQFASFTVNADGKLNNGMGGRDLIVTFNEHATLDMVQLLAGHIGFGIRLNNTDGTAAYTQAWGQYLPASGVQQSVTFTITDVGGRSNSATRDINVSAVNDAPVAHNDLATMGPSGTVKGWVLGNDDPDLLPNQGSGSSSLPAGLAVTDVWTGTSSHHTVGTSFAGAYGTMTLKADGTYTYVLNTSNSEVAALTTSSAPLLDVFHYTMTDGSASSSADLKIMIDALGAHWDAESKTSSNTTAVGASETIFKYAGASETQYIYGFGDKDFLGAVGTGSVKIDGGDGDDVMYALATYTSLKGGAGADKFVIGSADIHVRIEDIDILTSNATLDTTKDIVDFSPLFGGMSQTAIDAFFDTHMSQVTDAATGKISTLINFNGLGGVAHTGDLTLVGVTLAQAQNNVQGETNALSSVNYTLLDELRLIATHHG